MTKRFAMSFDSLNSVTGVVDEYGPMAFQDDSFAPSANGGAPSIPATRATARYGVRRPTRNTYESIIYSQAPVLPTDPSRVTSRQGCRSGACNRGSVTMDVLESQQVLSDNCRQPMRGPGQPEWVNQYCKRDELQQLLIDSEARDQLIAQAYRDIANQSTQIESKPVLCKALARLYQHGAHQPLKANPNWSDEDWQVAQWYCKNCAPFVTAAGSLTFSDRPLIPKKWLDNVVQSLGPAYNFMANKCMTNACDCASPSPVQSFTADFYQKTASKNVDGCGSINCPPAPMQNERNTFPNLPVVPGVLQKANCNPLARSSATQSMYGLVTNDEQGKDMMQKQEQLVTEQRQQLSGANQDYSQRIYQARVKDFRLGSACNQLRQTSFLDNLPSDNFSPLDQ